MRGAPLSAASSGGSQSVQSSGSEDDPKEAARRAVLAEALQKMQQSLPAGLTPLMLAAQCGTAGTVRELLAQGQDPATTDPKGHTALIFAVMRPSAEVVAALLEAPGTPLAARCEQGATALHLAAFTCHEAEAEAVEVLRLLLAAGADVNDTFDEGMTALMVAASRRSARAVQLLLRAGADPNAATASGATALYAAVQAGAPAVVTQLLAAGADPNAEAEAHQTPLHAAATLGADVAIIHALLAAGAQLTEDLHGRTPIAWAAAAGHIEAVGRLVAADMRQRESPAAVAKAEWIRERPSYHHRG